MSILDDFAKALEDAVEVLEGVVEGPLKEWAQTDIGKVIFRAMASSLTAGLAPILGPQLASVAFALPGLARGEKFDDAWWKEFSWRVEKTAQIAGPNVAQQIPLGEQLINQLKAAGIDLERRAREAFPNLPPDEALRRMSIGVEDLANALGIRDDIAAAALSLGRRLPLPARDAYDAATGQRIPMPSVRAALRRANVSGASIRAAITGQGTGGSLVQWMRGLP